MNKTSIRNFVLSDVDNLHQMIIDTIDTSYSSVYPERAVEFFKTFHSEERIRERNEKGEVLIIEKDREIVATGAIIENDVMAVFVRKPDQGKGYGKTIMYELEGRAIANGFMEITLAISLPSRKFYELLGYEIVRDCSLDVGEGQYLNYWEAKKTVAKN